MISFMQCSAQTVERSVCSSGERSDVWVTDLWIKSLGKRDGKTALNNSPTCQFQSIFRETQMRAVNEDAPSDVPTF